MHARTKEEKKKVDLEKEKGRLRTRMYQKEQKVPCQTGKEGALF